MKLSEHFSLEELTASETAARLGLDNEPPPEVEANLLRLALALEDVRDLLGGVPIIISSGYRAPAVNTAVHGSKTSAHVYGLAADFIAPAYGSPFEVCLALKGMMSYDQLIHEYGRWVHLGLAAEGKTPRGQLLTYLAAGQPPVSGILAV